MKIIHRDKSKRSAWLPSFPTNSHHLDAVPAATPINRNRTTTTTTKKKTFPLWYKELYFNVNSSLNI
jgi:hypothetical protein